MVALWPLAASTLENYTAYRLRLSEGIEPPEDLYGNADDGAPSTYAWEVRELTFTSNLSCSGALPIASAIASVGGAAGLPSLAFDSDNTTAWRAGCQAGVDATQECRDSWMDGAWLGAQFNEPVSVQCILLHHDGAPIGLTLESWDGSAWIQLQSYGPVNGSAMVELSRLQGGTCSSAPVAAHTSGLPRAPLCEPYTQWRLVAPGNQSAWAVYEMELYADALCHSRVNGGSPISSDGRMDVVTRFADGHLSTAWTAPCANDCAEGSLWAGFSFQVPENVTCVRLYQELVAEFTEESQYVLEVWNGSDWAQELSGGYASVVSREWSYVPPRVGENGSMWRLVNHAQVYESWAVHEVLFFSDAMCTQRLTGGVPISSDDPYRQGVWAPMAFDGDASTAWLSNCGPCSVGGAFIGLSFGSGREVRCTQLVQAEDMEYRPESVSLETWSQPEADWVSVATYSDLLGGPQLLTSVWGASSTRFAITNTAVAPEGWRVAEIRFFEDTECTLPITGYGYSSEEDPADAMRAFDLDTKTFWHASCCGAVGTESCTCQASDAWVGYMLLRATTVQCVHLMQTGWAQTLGETLFVTSRVALLSWDGATFVVLYDWADVPSDEWVELSIGTAPTALGSRRGCKDMIGWERCNDSGWNCSYVFLNDLCGEEYQSEVDCFGNSMAFACRESCCLCSEGNPAHCGATGDSGTGLVWLMDAVVIAIPAAAGLVVLLGCCQLWKRRLCHERKGCRRCCRCLDCLSRRKNDA